MAGPARKPAPPCSYQQAVENRIVTATAWLASPEDARTTPIETSLVLLETLHDRWIRILNAMSASDFDRKLNHPENGIMSLDQVLANYEGLEPRTNRYGDFVDDAMRG